MRTSNKNSNRRSIEMTIQDLKFAKELNLANMTFP